MFKMDDKEVVSLVNQLERFTDEGIGYATRSTINGMAFAGRKAWQEEIKENMVERNKFTKNSIRVIQSKHLDTRRQISRLGSIAQYMDEQEFGAVNTSSGKEGVPIATSYASGEGNARPRRRLPRKPNKMSSINLKRSKAKTTAGKVKAAAQSGDKYIFLKYNGGRRKGIFRIVGGKRKPRIRMVWDMSRKTTVIPKNPTLAPAVVIAEKKAPAIAVRSLEFQLRRFVR